jgi:hypothetical protein
VNGVREIYRLVERLLKSQYWNRLSEPPGDDERRHYTHYCNYTEATNSQYRHEHLG